jgi:hypothetical protein
VRSLFCTFSLIVAVLCKNQFYYFQALWPNTYEVAVDEYDILDILKAIQKHADALDPVEASKEALGVLTSLPRTQWAVTRNELCETEVNATALHVIDSALFVLVLDDYEETDINDAASNMLHGKYLYDFAVCFLAYFLRRWGLRTLRTFSHFLFGLLSLLRFFQVLVC